MAGLVPIIEQSTKRIFYDRYYGVSKSDLVGSAGPVLRELIELTITKSRFWVSYSPAYNCKTQRLFEEFMASKLRDNEGSRKRTRLKWLRTRLKHDSAKGDLLPCGRRLMTPAPLRVCIGP